MTCINIICHVFDLQLCSSFFFLAENMFFINGIGWKKKKFNFTAGNSVLHTVRQLIRLWKDKIALIALQYCYTGCIAGDLRYKEHDGTHVDCKDNISVCYFFVLFVDLFDCHFDFTLSVSPKWIKTSSSSQKTKLAFLVQSALLGWFGGWVH